MTIEEKNSHKQTELSEIVTDTANTGSVPEEKLAHILLSEFSTVEPLSPEDGIEQYLNSRTDIKDSTVDKYRNKLGYFKHFLNENNIDNLNELTGRTIESYRTWRRERSTEGSPLAPKTMRDDMFLIRDFLEYLRSINAVSNGLPQCVRIPNVEDPGRDYEMEEERLREITAYLEKYRYATIEHTLYELLKETGRRIGDIRALDYCDSNHDDPEQHLKLRHRPDETPLKNGKESEGQISISPSVAQVIQDYIENNRYDVTDDNGRRPLLTTRHGRPAPSTLRRYAYAWSRPCKIGQPCPHGKSPDTCEAAANTDQASKCKSSRPPHAFRHGYITELLRNGLPTNVITDRCDVSQRVLEEHYDERSEQEKRKQRAEILNDVRSNGGGYL